MGLLDLPREIRDLIYGHTFSNYTVIYPSTPPATRSTASTLPSIPRFKLGVPSKKTSRHPPITDLAILRVSKQINQEALQILYAHGIFRISFKDLDHLRPCFFSKDVTMNMRHVDLVINHEIYKSLRRPGDEHVMDKRFIFILKRLATLEHPQRTCRVILYCSFSRLKFQETAFCHALKTLGGFKTVALQFGYAPSSLRRAVKRIRGVLVEGYDELENPRDQYKPRRFAVEAELRESLGPARQLSKSRYRCLEFSPQEYRFQKDMGQRQDKLEHEL